jgi:hypothetical protein
MEGMDTDEGGNGEMHDEDEVTIYVNQRAYSLYVLWRCCFYQERADFSRLHCPISEIYATYYRTARAFDLVVQTILPHHVERFLRSFQTDGILCILEKPVTRDGKEVFVPCCVISSKWAFWYQGLISDSIGGGCIDLALSHSNNRIISIGKSLAETKRQRTFVGKNTRRTGKSGPFVPLLFSQRHGDRKDVFPDTARDPVEYVPESTENPYIARALPQEVYEPVVYDEGETLGVKHETYSDEEERAAISRMHPEACESTPATKDQEEVYRYIHRLQTGQIGPRISIGAAAASKEDLYQEYKMKSELLEQEFSERKKNRAQANARKAAVGVKGGDCTTIISKWIAWIHLKMQESAFEREVSRAVDSTPEIGEYLAMYLKKRTNPTPGPEPERKKKKVKKRKKKNKKASDSFVGKKAKRGKKRASARDTSSEVSAT